MDITLGGRADFPRPYENKSRLPTEGHNPWVQRAQEFAGQGDRKWSVDSNG